MEIDLLVGIIGIIATIIFGLIGIIIYRQKKYDGRISRITDKNIELYDSTVKDIEGLKLTYKGEEINQKLSITNIYLINLGNIDITKQLTEKEIQLSLPKDSQILNYKLKEVSLGLKCSIRQLNQQSLVFDLGLFKINEYLKLELLIESKDSISINKNLTFTHRIANTAPINEVKISPGIKTTKYKLKRFLPLLSITLLLFLGTITFSQLSYTSAKNDLHREVANYNEFKGILTSLLNSKDKIQDSLQAEYKNYIPLANQYKISLNRYQNYNFISHLISSKGFISLFLFFIFLVFLIWLINNYHKYKREIKIIKILK